ncbi:hypothetical protein D3C71_2092740 [compost metagenome]
MAEPEARVLNLDGSLVSHSSVPCERQIMGDVEGAGCIDHFNISCIVESMK